MATRPGREGDAAGPLTENGAVTFSDVSMKDQGSGVNPSIFCSYFRRPGLGCPTSQTDPSPRLHLSGANWRPWHIQLKLSLSQKVGSTAEVVTQIWDSQCIWDELHCEAGGLFVTLSVNRL